MTKQKVSNSRQEEQEIWRDIDGYNGSYQVSNHGSIRSYMRGKSPFMLKPSVNSKGYFGVSLYKDRDKNRLLVHRVVAMAFVDNPDGKPCINHKDGDKSNNNVENLEWVTHQENSSHACKNGLMRPRKGEAHGRAKLTKEDVRKIRRLYDTGNYTQKELGSDFDVSIFTISEVVTRKNWRHI